MKKTIISIIIVIVGLLFITQKNNNSKVIENTHGDIINSSNIVVGNDYVKLIIKDVLEEDNNLKIIAGRYRYGDVNRDGIINNLDNETIQFIINSYFTYTDNQRDLADLDQNGLVDAKDLNHLQNYLNKNGEIKYQYQVNNIIYAISTSKDKDNLTWQNSNIFSLNIEGRYYAFIQDNNKIYEPFEFNYEMNEEME